MAEFRLLQEEDFQQASDLADKVFRKAGHVSMGKAFPQVFSSALNQSYGAFDDGKLVSFIGLVPFVLHIGGAEVNAFSIGAVCTEPDYRRRGLANTLLQMIFGHIQKSGASVLFVSGDLPIYIKQGCTFYGKMNQYKLHEGDLQVEGSYIVRELQPYDWFQLRKLGNARQARYEQSIYELALLNERAAFASIFKMNHKVLVAEENGELKGFLMFGVPYGGEEKADSRAIEWGGDPRAVKTLLASAFTYGLNSLLANVPAFEKGLNQQLDSLEKKEIPFPGTMKIMNLDLLLAQLSPYFEDRLGISTVDENRKELHVNQRSLIVTNQELAEFILHGTKVDAGLQDVFPIPFPFPQGLNYV
ncbi:GNAT family N-acetyltransferase [Bacillus sp. FJAT-27245]|uniref:GNAT family N-acetyltransferase n=1 Tax=Bacillus sp. FJAT-27245 TaxID=1684144 RepID=UPI0006A78E60|nr:GNAT family N-acetyltransferase [Bacillus sp. FJAT-27245]